MSLSILLITAWPWFLAAGPRRADRIGYRYLTDNAALSPMQLLLVVAVIALIVLITWSFVNWKERRNEQTLNNPGKLFHELCRAHRLTSSQCQLLQDIATWHQLPNPNVLFLECERFNVPALVASLGNAPSIEAVRDILFDETPDEDRS